MHHIEIILNILLSVITEPSIYASQSLLHNVLIAVIDDVDIYEELRASIDIPKALTAAIDD